MKTEVEVNERALAQVVTDISSTSLEELSEQIRRLVQMPEQPTPKRIDLCPDPDVVLSDIRLSPGVTHCPADVQQMLEILRLFIIK